MDLHELTAAAGAARVRAGTLRPGDWMAACLDRIAGLEPQVRAFAWLDPAQARNAAARRPDASGALAGVPLGIKDVFETADMPTGHGSPIWDGHRPRADAACVAWARAAGAVPAGKTVTTEFATRRPGPTANPRNPAHTPGGSSSGSAAGVAAGFFPAALGSQTAGSIVRPAAFCGVVGFKPSFGTIARSGMKVMSEQLDTIGAFARTVEDCAIVVQALSGRPMGDPARRLPAPPRIGLCRGPTWERALPETAALMERVAAALTRAGADPVSAELPDGFDRYEHSHNVVMSVESARSLGWELAHARAAISPELLDRMDWALALPPEALAAAEAHFAQARAAFAGHMRALDVLVTPAATGQAPAGLGWTGDPCFNFTWTGLGVPCISVPAGDGPGGLPLGLQVVGRAGEDTRLLAAAEWVRAAIS